MPNSNPNSNLHRNHYPNFILNSVLLSGPLEDERFPLDFIEVDRIIDERFTEDITSEPTMGKPSQMAGNEPQSSKCGSDEYTVHDVCGDDSVGIVHRLAGDHPGDKRPAGDGNRTKTRELLVKWRSLQYEDTTWELKSVYLTLTLIGGYRLGARVCVPHPNPNWRILPGSSSLSWSLKTQRR